MSRNKMHSNFQDQLLPAPPPPPSSSLCSIWLSSLLLAGPGPYSGTPFSEYSGIFRQYYGTFRNIPANITEYSGTMYTQFRL